MRRRNRVRWRVACLLVRTADPFPSSSHSACTTVKASLLLHSQDRLSPVPCAPADARGHLPLQSPPTPLLCHARTGDRLRARAAQDVHLRVAPARPPHRLGACLRHAPPDERPCPRQRSCSGRANGRGAAPVARRPRFRACSARIGAVGHVRPQRARIGRSVASSGAGLRHTGRKCARRARTARRARIRGAAV